MIRQATQAPMTYPLCRFAKHGGLHLRNQIIRQGMTHRNSTGPVAARLVELYMQSAAIIPRNKSGSPAEKTPVFARLVTPRRPWYVGRPAFAQRTFTAASTTRPSGRAHRSQPRRPPVSSPTSESPCEQNGKATEDGGGRRRGCCCAVGGAEYLDAGAIGESGRGNIALFSVPFSLMLLKPRTAAIAHQHSYQDRAGLRCGPLARNTLGGCPWPTAVKQRRRVCRFRAGEVDWEPAPVRQDGSSWHSS